MVTVDTIKTASHRAVITGDPCTMVIFGAGGDLTKRKLLPAIYNMVQSKLLSPNFSIIGVDLPKLSTEQFVEQLRSAVKELIIDQTDDKTWDWLFERFQYVSGDFYSTDSYKSLHGALCEMEKKFSTGGNCLYYLATPPRCFGEIAKQLGAAGLTGQDRGWKRLVIEKPFGRDLNSATALNQELGSALKEDQIFRIDHYLGKETVQNIMVFRFANGIFEPVWNNKCIDNIQITVAEQVGVEHRGGYYDHAGALRDMVQNHIFQLVGLIAMEPPARFEPTMVRDRKRELLSHVRPIKPADVFKNVVRGQYTSGTVNGQQVADYRKEPQVDPKSMTETFVALKVDIDNERWSGVPFYLRTGKALASRESEIAIQFNKSPFTVFGKDAVEHLNPNTLILRIQPDEGIKLQFAAKIPGPVVDMEIVKMDFEYCDYFEKDSTNGYETLLYDIMIGESMLFPRADNLEKCWSLIDPILDAWESSSEETLYHYQAGSSGPDQAEDLIHRDGRMWRQLI